MWLLNHEESYRYQMLYRMRCDCDYYLGFGSGLTKYLWAGNEKDQIRYMKLLWNSFPADQKPEWLTWEQILNYERRMGLSEDSNASEDNQVGETPAKG